MSEEEVSLPKEILIRELASLLGTPMAERTWEGETEPEEQADPLLAQNPSKSNPESREILSA